MHSSSQKQQTRAPLPVPTRGQLEANLTLLADAIALEIHSGDLIRRDKFMSRLHERALYAAQLVEQQVEAYKVAAGRNAMMRVAAGDSLFYAPNFPYELLGVAFQNVEQVRT
jgi:hypothetical protein